MQDSVTTRLDWNPLAISTPILTTPLSPVTPIVNSPMINTQMVFDPILQQHIFAQSFGPNQILTAPVLERAKESAKWLIEHVPTASLAIRGSKILARKYSDGYYYPATIGSVSPDNNGNFIIEFDDKINDLRMQKTSWFDMVSLDDALTHSIQSGDFCLAPFEKNGLRYAPGRVIDGHDEDRIGASLRNQGSNYEGEKKILCQFGKNLTKNVKSSKCIWIPQVLYERLCLESGKVGKRDNVSDVSSQGIQSLNVSAASLGLIKYSDIPILPMPTCPGIPWYDAGLANLWNALGPVMYNGGTYIPTYPYIWSRQFWPPQHQVICEQLQVQPQPGQLIKETEDLANTQQALDKLQHVASSDEDLDFQNLNLDDSNCPELQEWRAKRALKSNIRNKLKEDDCELVTSDSDSEEDSGFVSRPVSNRISFNDAAVQINAEPRAIMDVPSKDKRRVKRYSKRYSRHKTIEKPAWIKYWKQSGKYQNKTQLTMQNIGYVDPSRMHAAGGSGRPLTQEEKLYSLELDNAKNMRKVHDKLSQEERQKVRLQQAREKRVLNRLQEDLKREVGNSMPGCGVFSYNNAGDVFHFDQPKPTHNDISMQAGEVAGTSTQTINNRAGVEQISRGRTLARGASHPVNEPNKYSIGSQTFVERNVAVQVDP